MCVLGGTGTVAGPIVGAALYEWLRGFLIKRPSGLRTFPAFLFTKSDARSGTWTYLGEYHPPVTSESADDRVLPFNFRLPDSERFAPSTRFCNPALGRRLLCDHCLCLGWQLATGTRLPPDEWPSSTKIDHMAT